MNGDSSLSTFLAGWELFRDPVIAGVAAGALLGYLGVFIVLRRMVFLSASLTQAAGLGVAAEFYAQLHWGLTGVLASPLLGATLSTLLAALLLVSARAARGARRDGLLGFAYLVGAAGTVALGTRIVQEVSDIHEILFGSAVVVLRDDLWLVVGSAALLLALHVWWRRGFVETTLDREGAAVRGLPVTLLEPALLVTLAVAISVNTRVLGALPVFAFSVLPALAATRVLPSVGLCLAAAALIGAASGGLGYLVAYLWALPVGAAQTLLAAAAVPIASALARLVDRRAPTRRPVPAPT